MDKTEFVREAPTFYALAIAVQITRSGESISRNQIRKNYLYQFDPDDSDTSVNLLDNTALWTRAVEWLREREMISIRTFPFAPSVYSRHEKFSSKWLELLDGESIFGVYGRMSDGASWLHDALISIYREAETLQVSEMDFVRLTSERPKVLDTWDELDHRPVSTPELNHENLTDEDAIDGIQSWFFENFEEAVQNTPYNSREGGYLYIHGGPYDAREIIEAVFAHYVSDDVINEVIDQIEHQGDTWVPSSNRRIAPEEEFDDPPVEYLHRRMRKRIDELEELLRDDSSAVAGIGHNNPPESIEGQPIRTEEKEEILEALGVLNSQPVRPSSTEAADAALTKLVSIRKKLTSWAATQAKVFTEEAVKEAGKQTGKWAPRAFWLVVLDNLLSVTQHAESWLKAIQALAPH
jgi:hypothetical protein